MPGKAKLKPKGKRGLAAVKRLGRTYKTGNFAKGVQDLMDAGSSHEAAQKIMGAQYWKEVAKAKGKKKPGKGRAKKGK
jgi:hypothetical protein